MRIWVKCVLLATLCGSTICLSQKMGSVAQADSGSGTVSVSGGSLGEVIGSLSLPSVTLNGADQTISYSFPITVTDATGTGNGWNLTITSTEFTATIGGVSKTLPNSASIITNVTSVCVVGSTCTSQSNNVVFPLTIPAGATAPSAVKLFNAASNTGMGKFTVTPTVSLTIPGNTFAGTYSSTITLAIVSGP